MAEIGDKAFTTEMVQEIKRAVMAELGTNAFVKRYLATVSAVNTTTSEVTVYLSGSDITSAGFYARGILLPVIGDRVVACIDGSDRWIEDVIRPQTATPYITFATAAAVPTGAVVAWLTGTAPTGWLFCDGTSYAYNTYPALGALLGGSAGGNFTTPDMRDRFLGSLGTVGAWSNTTGLIGPNSTITNNREHTHNTDLAHGHSFSAGAHVHNVNVPSHTHTVNPPSTESGNASVGSVDATQFAYIASNATYRAHTHFTNIVTLDSGAHDEAAFESGSANYSTAASVTSLGETLETSSAATYGGSNILPKSTRLNFIIKT